MKRRHARSRGAHRLALYAATASFATSAGAQNSARSSAPLEEIIVTATRVTTNLQQTPLSVAVFTGEQLELAGIDSGRDLGIMVPNVVLNPGALGERSIASTIRGLPGVTTYIDGVWLDNVGFLQRSFVEIDRVEILRGPQGTLFGRNTNGGAVQIITRRPGEDLRAQLDVEVGEFERRTVKAAVDVPLGNRVKTKWTAASDDSEGFMPSRSAELTFGSQKNRLLRGDVFWDPTDRFTLRFNLNREDRESTPPRIVRITNQQHPFNVAYNVLAGNPDYLAQARGIDPSFPDPPIRDWSRSIHGREPRGRISRW